MDLIDKIENMWRDAVLSDLEAAWILRKIIDERPVPADRAMRAKEILETIYRIPR